MFGEQQKQEIRSIIAEEIKGLNESLLSLKDSLETFALPFKSQFKQLTFQGLANNLDLVKNYNDDDLRGKYILIKSIKVIPYYINASQDISLTDGVNNFIETIPQSIRVNRLLDNFFANSFLTILINNAPLNLFTSLNQSIIPLNPLHLVNYDLGSEIDNIYFKYPEKVDSLSVRFLGEMLSTFNPQTEDNLYVRVYIQCYTF